MPDSIELFHFHGMCGRVSCAALEEVKADYTIRIVDYFSEAARNKYYRDINPSGRFPAARIGSDIVIENVAILLYVNDIYPNADLLPLADTAPKVAMQRADLIYCSATLHPILTRARSPTRIIDGQDKQMEVRQKAIQTLLPHLERINVRLKDNGGYWYGEWSIVDNYLWWIHWIFNGCHVDLGHLESLTDLCRRIEERPATQRMLEREKAAMAQAGVPEPRL